MLSVHRPRTLALGLLLALPTATVLVVALAPGTLDEKLMLLLRGVCAQRPSHSFLVDGRPLALEARMFGIFVGFAVAVAAAWLAGRWRRSALPKGMSFWVLSTCLALMVLDGFNALLFDLRAAHLYPPSNELRLFTGLASGLGLAAFIAPVVSFAFFRERDPRPMFSSLREIIVSGTPLVLVAGIVAWGGAPGLALSVLAALAVVGTFWLVNTYICVLAWEGVGRASAWRDLAPSAVVGFLLTGGLLVGLSLLRGWVEATLGLSWAV